ncbi:MAG: BMP family ABC transporter substrate-binding protein [Actinomycetota bacterium]
MKRRKVIAAALAAAAMIVAAACGGDDAATEEVTEDTAAEATEETMAPAEDYSMVKAAVVYITTPGDMGWSYMHDQGIKYMEEQLGIEVTRLELIPEGAEATATFDKLARDGYNLIMGTSFGYMDPMLEVAAKYPNVCFQHASGYKNADNMGNYFGAMEEARYLSGIAAGSASKSGKLGYVAAFPIPEVIRGINAFTLGARSVNPAATVQVAWTSTWYDPAKEKEAAQSLLAAGADVLAQHQDSTATGEAAKEAGAKWVGYNSDVAAADFPDNWLTSPKWNWGPHYVKLGKDVAAGKCDNSPYYGTMADGMITLGTYGSSVSQATQDLIAEKAAAIIDGSLKPFTGPIKDNEGKEQIAAGASAALGDLLGQSYLVEGVIGSAKG